MNRCAIYTRKSTEEGLEQEFNSLDAQRESGEAFIASQQHEGWECLPEHYDDGGFTGGNTDRPALQRLLADIEAGLIDTVVVYKVDRLSRSLLDFARILRTFEKHNVSFVSVTQQFNTATSMGRLMLNILLSFAQFEREMISERTRDKMAAVRRKGKWAGGMPILGYDVEKSKLRINADEAEQVREIFRLYLEHKALMPVVKELNRRGWQRKQWTTRKNTIRGGGPFKKATVHAVLTNVAYIGKVRYKDEVHEGEHQGIVDAEVFEQVHAVLNRNARTGGRTMQNKYGALLRGLLRCATCECAMSHRYTAKKKSLYRYYVCRQAQQQGWEACPTPSVPAPEIEQFVVEQIKGIGRDPVLLRETLAQARREAEETIKRLETERAGLKRQIRRDEAESAKLGTATDAHAVDRLADLQDRRFGAERRLTEIHEELLALRCHLVDEAEVETALRAFDPVWECLSPKEQSRVLELLIERVEFDGESGQVSIVFHSTGFHGLIQRLAEEDDA